MEAEQKGYRVDLLQYIFCSDEYLLRLNKQSLNHNYFTDILTFPYSGGKKVLEADIFISVDRVKENASLLRVPFHQELLRIIFHGLLHLIGYDDNSPRSKAAIAKEEDRIIQYFLRFT